MKKTDYQTGVKVGEAKIGITTNSRHLVGKDKFFWLDTNFVSVDFLPFEECNDSFFEVIDSSRDVSLEVTGKTLTFKGLFTRWDKDANDKRYTLFGNLGIFSSWVLRTLEEVHDIYTFHACGLCKDEELMIIPGGGGSGKTVFILSALRKGWKIFSTEFVHFRVGESVEFFKGSVKDAVRVDTFQYWFPDMAQKLGVDLQEETGSKLAVDFSPFSVEEYCLIDPLVTLVFPHVEENRKRVIEKQVKDKELLLRNLFMNASEKIGKSLLLYGDLAVPGIDTLELAEKRKASLLKFLQKSRIQRAFNWVSGIDEVERIV